MASEVDDDDDWIAPTQVAHAAPATSHTSTAAAATHNAVDQRVLCAVCSINLSLWTIQDRAVHMNACLDAATTMRCKYECPTCNKELTDYNEQRRMVHVNMCLDRMFGIGNGSGGSGSRSTTGIVEREHAAAQDAAASAATSTQAEDRDTYNCMICGVDLTQKDLSARIRHVKQCGLRFGVRPSDMAALQGAQQQMQVEGQLSATEAEQAVVEITYDYEAGFTAETASTTTEEGSGASTNAFAVMMRASSASSSVLSSTMGRVGQVVSNAFDVLMKSSKTQAVLSSTSSNASSSSFRSNPQRQQQTSQRFDKKRRIGGASSSGSSWGSSSNNDALSARTRPCPDFKRIRGTQPSFIVDGFKYASKALSSVYFLTHFHSDHYIGLEKSFEYGIIYCNQITAALVVQELRIDSKWVHPVPMNTPVTIHDVQVTFMDANHCPGAAIILFRLKNGQAYLHTGDFRYHPKMLSYGPLQSYIPSLSSSSSSGPSNNSALNRLDGIYLDTTYADPKYVFPTQQTAIDHALELVKKHSLSDKILYLFGSYSIGKERLFMEVATRYQRKVCVSKAKLKFIQTFHWSESQMKLITTETGATNLHVVPMQDLKMEHLMALLAKHRLRFRQIVAFRPTGWTFSKTSQSISTCRTDPSGCIYIYGVPYSEHSSFAELAEFIQKTNPHLIIPTVNCHTEKAAKKQVDAIRQVAFHSISNLFHTALAVPFSQNQSPSKDSHVLRTAMSRSRVQEDTQVLSLDNPTHSTGAATTSTQSSSSSRPGTSSGRSKQPKVSEFRQYLEQNELPLAITTRYGERRVTWASNVEQLDFAHLLPICLSGLQEALEPYPTFAFDAVMGLLEAGRGDSRVLRALPQVMNQVKSALSTREKAVVHRVLLVLQQLAVCDGVGEALGDYYRAILPLCNILQDKHLGTGDDRTREMVADALETLEAYGRDDAYVLIQQYVPTFQSCGVA